MSTQLRALFVVLALIAGVHQAAAQGTRFFRISGPAATGITALRPDGTLVWSNALAGTNYTVQSAALLSGGSNWTDYIQVPATNSVNTNQIVDFNPPAGMAFIPAGSFTMGNMLIMGGTVTNEADIYNASPTNIYVSAFYMDVNLVTYGQWLSVRAYATNNGYVFTQIGQGKAANYPVEDVYWYDSVKWCNARSQQESLTPVYYTDTNWTQIYTNSAFNNIVYPN